MEIIMEFTMRSVFAFDWYCIKSVWQHWLSGGQGLLCNKYGRFVGQIFFFLTNLVSVKVIKRSAGNEKVRRS